MLGSIIGDIVGSVYEFANIKTKEFPLFNDRGSYTDDSILSVATADWLLHGGVMGGALAAPERLQALQFMRQRQRHACRTCGLGFRYEGADA